MFWRRNGQLERFPGDDARRQANAKRLTEGIDQIPGLNHVRIIGLSMKHGYYYYLLKYEPDTYANLDPGAKMLLTVAMLLGRLEFFTVLVVLTRSFWPALP